MEKLDANLRSDEDSISSLEVREQNGNQYIPYTNKALSWHTDGYYNPLDKQIFGIIHAFGQWEVMMRWFSGRWFVTTVLFMILSV